MLQCGYRGSLRKKLSVGVFAGGLHFLLQQSVGIKQLQAIVGQRAAVCSVADEKLNVQRILGFLDDAPCFAVGHAQILGSGIQRTCIAYPFAQRCDAGAEYGIGL